MVRKSSKSEQIRDDLRSRVESKNVSEVSEVTTRECESDRFNGVQVKFYGNIVPVRPIIDYVAEQDSLGIEAMGHYTDSGDPYFGVFIAYLPEQDHPAFV